MTSIKLPRILMNEELDLLLAKAELLSSRDDNMVTVYDGDHQPIGLYELETFDTTTVFKRVAVKEVTAHG